MRARFRIVHFVPHPFAEARVPIAALIQGANRLVRVALSPFVPGPGCVGGQAAWASLSMALEDLKQANSFEVLPPSIGPHFRLSEPRSVPETVVDAAKWVEANVLPRRPIQAEDQVERPPPTAQRKSRGWAFFRTWNVAEYVRKNYDGESLNVSPETAQKIAHWVPGQRELLLMEPVVGNREDLATELRDISQAFLAWQSIFRNHNVKRLPTFVAYVLHNDRGAATSHARDSLLESKALVVDVDVPSEREALLERIRQVGRSGGQQSGLPLH